MRMRAIRRALAVVLVGGAIVSCSSGVTTGAGPSAGNAGTTPATGVATTAAAGAPPVASKGCSSTTAPAAEDKQKHVLTIAGADRYYLLTTPASADASKPLPLVVDFHGLSEGAEVHLEMTKFSEMGKTHGFVVATPNGQGQPVHWDASTASHPNQDVDFVDAFLNQIETEHCIDTSRVYATGLSYGAIMSSFLTCVRADRFAAVAPVAGITIHKDCNPSRPMPVITFHGTADPILKFNGGVDLSGISAKPADGGTTTTVPADLNGPGYPTNVADWAKRNGCKSTSTDTKVTDSVIHRVYDCPDNAAVEFYIVVGGGHAWPGSEFSKSIERVVGPTTMEINADDLIWAFFQRFHL